MKTFLGTIFLMAVFLSSSLALGADAEDYDSFHHDHPGLTDASGSFADHAHGDSDDHHTGPNDTCHHHVIHCGCSHAHLSGPIPVTGLVSPVISDRINLTPGFLANAVALVRIFHIPIA